MKTNKASTKTDSSTIQKETKPVYTVENKEKYNYLSYYKEILTLEIASEILGIDKTTLCNNYGQIVHRKEGARTAYVLYDELINMVSNLPTIR